VPHLRNVGSWFVRADHARLSRRFYVPCCLLGRLLLQDTAGQERFHALGPIYYRESQGAVLVYDITDEDSFVKVGGELGRRRRVLVLLVTGCHWCWCCGFSSCNPAHNAAFGVVLFQPALLNLKKSMEDAA
jgi:hypothetical protein